MSGEDLQLSKYPADNNNNDNNNDEPLAKLLVADDDSDIVQVLKISLLKNRFLEEAFTSPDMHYKASNRTQRPIVCCCRT